MVAMIVPRSRLLFWVAAVVLPCALLAALRPGAGPVCILAVGGLFAAALADALRAPRSLAGLEVELLPIVRMSKNREASLELRIRNEPPRRRSLRVALDLPLEISASTEELDVVLAAGAEWSRVVWTCSPVKRGIYRIVAVYLEGVSALGFWAPRKAVPARTEIRVYPNLVRERRSLAALFLRRGSFGLHVQRQVGQGRDFEKLREYVPGDSFDEIDWKASARRGKPITKVFQIERTQEIYVVVDASRLSARPVAPGAPDTILERLVTACLVLGLAAEQQGDLFGVLAFTNRVETFVRAKRGKTHYSACRDALYTLQPQTITPDFDELCTFIRLQLRRRALIIFLTSLDDPALAESFVRNIHLIRRQHLILVNMIRQSGTGPLFTDSSVESVDDLYPRLGGHLRWQKLRQLEKTLQRRGIGFSLIENERLSADLVSQYLSVKQRQLI
jgi:uncharacterized protein (DUF58 family)